MLEKKHSENDNDNILKMKYMVAEVKNVTEELEDGEIFQYVGK